MISSQQMQMHDVLLPPNIRHYQTWYVSIKYKINRTWIKVLEKVTSLKFNVLNIVENLKDLAMADIFGDFDDFDDLGMQGGAAMEDPE